ncbi:23S rRNA (guanosine2251-2'-O)-methyltransferase [Lachnospiraceae bacterium NK3A20]|nr:23S rRNA (guanosine2251-2'-O)-methyltransferase [Lachnospiraceae bacterium NK3A20]
MEDNRKKDAATSGAQKERKPGDKGQRQGRRNFRRKTGEPRESFVGYQIDAQTTIDENESRIEGRNAVTEAFRAGKTIDRLYVLDGCVDGPVLTIKRMAAKAGTPIKYLSRQRLDQMSETGKHQGVIAIVAAYHYGTLDDLFRRAEEKKADPFFIILDNIEDPHNLGAIIRTANVVGAQGVIIPKDRAVGLTATVAKASAGAINFTPVVKVTNIAKTIEELKKRGMWFVCADMDGTPMTKLNLAGPIGMVVGAEGNGVSRLVKEKCDIIASIPQQGEINSLNASVAAGVLAYEILRQRSK